MLVGDIILCRRDKSLVDDAIALAEELDGDEGEYSHVAIYVGNGTISEAQGGEPCGFYPLSKYDPNRYDVGRVHMLATQRAKVYDASKAEHGRRYGWRSILAIILFTLFRIKLKDVGRDPVCTEHVQNVLRKVLGFNITDTNIPLPDDIAYSPYVDIL